jgi:uncharacterized protein (TIRG00374 family)
MWSTVRVNRAVIGLGLVTTLYVLVLVSIDSGNQIFNRLPELVSALPVMLAIALASYATRFVRWRWLLHRAGHVTPFTAGFLAYMAGLAFTATPGKVGELVRIRYYAPWGVPPSKVLAAFVLERGLDLLVVLALACLFVRSQDLLLMVAAFTFCFVGAIITLAMHPVALDWTICRLTLWKIRRIARLAQILRDGLVGCRTWFRALDMVVGALLGFVAWTLTSLSFVYLLDHLGLDIPVRESVAIYPLSMLVGAASMLPGGLGSTETTIVGLLSLYTANLSLAVLAAIGIRFSTLWFAIVCGVLAMLRLEAGFRR